MYTAILLTRSRFTRYKIFVNCRNGQVKEKAQYLETNSRRFRLTVLCSTLVDRSTTCRQLRRRRVPLPDPRPYWLQTVVRNQVQSLL